jgi:hypothetical protein
MRQMFLLRPLHDNGMHERMDTFIQLGAVSSHVEEQDVRTHTSLQRRYNQVYHHSHRNINRIVRGIASIDRESMARRGTQSTEDFAFFDILGVSLQR